MFNVPFYWREIEEQSRRKLAFDDLTENQNDENERDFNSKAILKWFFLFFFFKNHLKSQYTRSIYGDVYNVRTP